MTVSPATDRQGSGSGASGVLYTPELLALAAGLANYPMDASYPLQGTARSRVCGSIVFAALMLDEDTRVEGIGLRVSACAIGQAAAAVFARGAQGRPTTQLANARDEIACWLNGAKDVPDWPGMAALIPALPYPARHPAILLPWDAALNALQAGPR